MSFSDLLSPSFIPIIIFSSIIIIVIFLVSNAKSSPATLEKLIRDYNVFVDMCNEVTRDINDVISRIKEKIFVSVTDEENAFSTIRKYDFLYNELLILNDKMGFYIIKRNSKYYKKFRKDADNVLIQLKDMLNSLQSIESYMETEERYYEAEASRKYRYTYEENTESEEEVWEEVWRAREEQKKERKEAEEKENTSFASKEVSGDIFFAGCNNMEDIEKRYKSLAKVYHPDMPTGDKDTFQIISKEYKKRKGRI